jgi:hypothetical protein
MNAPRMLRAGIAGLMPLFLAAVFMTIQGAAVVANDESPSPSASYVPQDPAAVAELRAHIPDAVGTDCAEDPLELSHVENGVLARILCTTSEQAWVRYELFDGVDTLDAQFAVTHTVWATIMPHVEGADTCAEGWHDGIWFVGDHGAGRLLCVKPLYGDPVAIVAWSHPEFRILSLIRQADGDAEAAWNLWIVAGPD